MKRRILARVLCCLIALMLPVSAMASVPGTDLLQEAHANGKEINTTITFTPGASLASIQALNDLTKAMALQFSYLPGGNVGLSIKLNNEDAIALQSRVDKQGVYMSSALLGEKPVYIAFADLSTIIVKTLREQGFEEAQVAQIEDNFAKILSGNIVAQTAEQTVDAKKLTDEEIYAEITKAMNGDEGMANWIKSIKDRAVVTKGEFAGEDHDTADTKTEITLTQDDYAAMFDIQYIKDQIKTQLAAQNASLSAEEADKKADDEIAEIQKMFKESVINVPITVLTFGEESLCAVLVDNARFEMKNETVKTFDENAASEGTDSSVGDLLIEENVAEAPAEADAEPKTTVVVMNMNVAKKTTETGKVYTGSMKAIENDADVFNAKGTLTKDGANLVLDASITDGSDKPVINVAAAYQPTDSAVVAEAAITLADENTFVLSYNHAVSENAIDGSLSIATGESVAEIAAKPESVLGTINFRTVVQDDSGLFSKIVSATPETSVEVLKLSEDEMTTYSQEVMSYSSQALFAVIGKLPSSVFDLISPFITSK